MPNLQISLLGSPTIKKGQTPIQIEFEKALALLAYLANTAEAQRRDTLATLLWPNVAQQKARGSLRHALVVLKKALGSSYFVADRQTIGLNWQAELSVDSHHFRQTLASLPATLDREGAATLRQALDLYRNDFLTGFSIRDSRNFDEWLLFETEHLRERYKRGLATLIDYDQAQQSWHTAIDYAQKLVALDSWHEPAHHKLITLYAQSGQKVKAARQYERCVQILADELGIEPTAGTQALYQTIQQQTATIGASAVAPHPTNKTASKIKGAPPQHNLPIPPNRFVGREQELQEIGLILCNPHDKLITLLGLGGMGKSRLAVQAVRQNLDRISHRVCYLNLAPLSQPERLLLKICEALGVKIERNTAETEAQLLLFLQNQPTLLILDQLEHLMAGVDLISRILGDSAHTKVLATSRERLNLQEEWVYQLQGLSTPEKITPSDLTSYGAVQLFAERGRQARHTYSLIEEWRDTVRICQLVQGMPLGIELAAAWVNMMPCADIAQEIQHNLDILATTARNVPDRQRSIRAVFAHSWQLLTPIEQRTITQLAVFQGVFTRQAALEVAQAPLFVLASLINKSLLSYTPAGRYTLHPLVRQYAAEKLEHGEATHERHASFYGRFLQQQETRLSTAETTAALNAIRTNLPDVRAGWLWATQQRHEPLLSQYVLPLYDFYISMNWYQEGSQLFGNTLDLLTRDLSEKSAAETALRFKIMTRQAEFIYELGHAEKALDQLQDALAYTIDHPHIGEEFHIQRMIGRIYYHLGQYPLAKQHLNNCILLDAAQHDLPGKAYIFLLLGAIVSAMGDYEEAWGWYKKSLQTYRQIEKKWGIAHASRSLGKVSKRLGRLEEAKLLFEEGLNLFKEITDMYGVSLCLNHLGEVAQVDGNLSQAKLWFEQSLQIVEKNQLHVMQPITLNHLGEVCGQLGEYQQSQAHLRRSVEKAMQIKATPDLLQGLLHIAQLFANPTAQLMAPHTDSAVAVQQNQIKSLELVNFVCQHPASKEETRYKARLLETAVAKQLPTHIVDTISSHPQTVNHLIQNLLPATI